MYAVVNQADTIIKAACAQKREGVLKMDAAASWQAFACTGNILRYLDYKQLVQLPAEHPAGETDDGTIRDHGSGIEGDAL